MDLTFGDPLVSSNNLLAESLVFFQTGMIAPKNQAHKHTTNWSMAYVAFLVIWLYEKTCRWNGRSGQSQHVIYDI
ncbi:MAG TPA: hypothetical protein DEQ24_08365 [Enterococcus sp.]|nr:hypothetical protein [Enterococcus sp.]